MYHFKVMIIYNAPILQAVYVVILRGGHPEIFSIIADDFVAFLQRCVRGLNPDGGLICIKDNISRDDDDVFDEEDSSVVRSLPSLLGIIEKAGLTIVQEETQENFPAKMFEVKT